ncbi:hypothetical protein QBC45DRAFT_455648 [Copromyces sp. CBS 386.78]|nr:hypothetical protein QBC45DRAFT_455648 [Copromyces sp. CBS 386.78]
MELSIARRWCVASTTDAHDRRTRSWAIWTSLGLDPDVAAAWSQKVVRRGKETQSWMTLSGTATGTGKRTGSGSHWKLTEL